MARTSLTVRDIVRAGVTQADAVYADITNNHQILENDGRMFLEMANVSNASSVNVTFDIPQYYDEDLSIVDIIVAVAPGGVMYAGPWKTGIFNQPSNNAVNFDVSSTGVSFRAYRLAP